MGRSKRDHAEIGYVKHCLNIGCTFRVDLKRGWHKLRRRLIMPLIKAQLVNVTYQDDKYIMVQADERYYGQPRKARKGK